MDFVEFCRKNQSDVTLSLPALTQANGVFSEGVLTLATTSAIQYEQLSAPSRLSELERLASDYSGKAVSVQVSAPERLHKTEADSKKEFASHPVIKSLTETFGELEEIFEEANPGVDVRFNFAGSQDLVTQLGEGADVDVLATANESTMKKAADARRSTRRPSSSPTPSPSSRRPHGKPGGR